MLAPGDAERSRSYAAARSCTVMQSCTAVSTAEKDRRPYSGRSNAITVHNGHDYARLVFLKTGFSYIIVRHIVLG